MADSPAARTWIGRLIYTGLACLLIFVQLLPFDMVPDLWAPPDLLLAMTCAFVLRRPDYLPVALIAAIFLVADMLFQRPPGLWAAIVLILTESLRKRAHSMRDVSLMLEWVTVASMLAIATAAERVILGLAMTAQAPLGLSLTELASTIFAYPVVVAVTHFLLGVRKAAPGEVDALGHKL